MATYFAETGLTIGQHLPACILGWQDFTIFANLRLALVDTYLPIKISLKFEGSQLLRGQYKTLRTKINILLQKSISFQTVHNSIK